VWPSLTDEDWERRKIELRGHWTVAYSRDRPLAEYLVHKGAVTLYFGRNRRYDAMPYRQWPALAWVPRDPGMTSAIVGASKVAQVDQNIMALEDLHFSESEPSRIDGISLHKVAIS
jgi:hypothetical protein